MKKLLNTIYHDSTKHYVSNPYPKRGETIEIKLRIKSNNEVKAIYIRYRDQGAERISEMRFAYEKNSLSYYIVDMECYDKIMSYNFNILTEEKIYYYSQHQITDYLVDDSTNFKIIVDYKDAGWMANSVFYQIIPDRFYNARDEISHKTDSFEYRGARPTKIEWGEVPKEYDEAHCMDFFGGDLYGIKDKLDYLKELGVNALYLTPIFTAPTIHKYDALDYFEIDPSLGGEEALSELTKELHDNNMKIILDISINHTSSSSKMFNMDGEFYPKNIGAYNNPESNERDYYFINEDGSYESWAGVSSMPSLNYESQALRDLIYRDEHSVLKKWINPPFNINGWRFDVADVMGRNRIVDVYEDLWKEINSNLKNLKEDVVLLAEEWNHTPEMYKGDMWDSTMNYFMSARPIREFAGEFDLLTARVKELRDVENSFKAEHFKDKYERAFRLIPTQIQYQMLNLIDSHDITRLHNNPDISIDVVKGAIITLFGLPGAVNIYYGDEKYLDGRLGSVEGARYSMDWKDTMPVHKKDVFNLYKTLAKLKTKNEALVFGGFKILYAKGDVFSFVRFTEDEAYLFTWNKSHDEVLLEIDLDFLGLYNNFEFIIGNGEISKTENILQLKFDGQVSSVLRIR